MPHESQKPDPQNPAPSNDQASHLGRVGKLVGLLMSVAFFGLAFWYLTSGTAAAALRGQQEVFYALMIILGGPIPYFFVSSATSASLKTPLGRWTITGGYVIAIFAVYFVTTLMKEREVWRRFTLDNIEQKIESSRIQIWTESGGVELHKEGTELNKPFQFMCCFHGEDAKTLVIIQIPEPVDGFRYIRQPLLRNGNCFQMIELYRQDSSANNASSPTSPYDRQPL